MSPQGLDEKIGKSTARRNAEKMQRKEARHFWASQKQWQNNGGKGELQLIDKGVK